MDMEALSFQESKAKALNKSVVIVSCESIEDQSAAVNCTSMTFYHIGTDKHPRLFFIYVNDLLELRRSGTILCSLYVPKFGRQ